MILWALAWALAHQQLATRRDELAYISDTLQSSPWVPSSSGKAMLAALRRPKGRQATRDVGNEP